jgi:hypothetical protein
MLIPLGVLSAAGGAPAGAGDYELIATEILGSSQSSVVFSNLGDYSSTYKHLQIRAVARVTESTTIRLQIMRYNGDSGANYSQHFMLADGSSVVSTGSANITSGVAFYINGNSNPTGAFGAGVIDILDPFSTTKYTTTRSFGGQTGYSIMNLGSNSWRNTASLTSIEIFTEVSNTYAAGSRFSLYGIKG